jgi:ABC-type nitrate/sulfonate/bicarbonate transport system substrate-binding protein
MNGRCASLRSLPKAILDTNSMVDCIRLLIAVVFSLSLLAVPTSLPALEKVSITHSVALSASIAPLLYGIHRGFFKDENIDIEYRILRADIGIKALLNGEVDYTYSAGTAIRASIRGLPIRALSYDLERLLHFLMGRPGVTNANDLKGKIIGVSSFGASGDVAARACLTSMGIDLKKDVTLVSMGVDSIRYNAIKAGSVEAIIAPLPRNIMMKKEGFTELCYAGRLFKGAVGGVIATIDRIHKKPAQARAVLRGMLRTSRSLKKEKNEFVNFLSTRIKLERDVADETATILIDGQTKDGMIDEIDLQAAIESEKQILRVEKPVKTSDVADYSLIREIIKKEESAAAR